MIDSERLPVFLLACIAMLAVFSPSGPSESWVLKKKDSATKVKQEARKPKIIWEAPKLEPDLGDFNFPPPFVIGDDEKVNVTTKGKMNEGKSGYAISGQQLDLNDESFLPESVHKIVNTFSHDDSKADRAKKKEKAREAIRKYVEDDPDMEKLFMKIVNKASRKWRVKEEK